MLLIIFMVTTTAVHEEGKNIDLPSAEVAEETPPEGVTVEINSLGLLKVNAEPVAQADLGAALEAALKVAEDKVVVLKGGPERSAWPSGEHPGLGPEGRGRGHCHRDPAAAGKLSRPRWG